LRLRLPDPFPLSAVPRRLFALTPLGLATALATAGPAAAQVSLSASLDSDYRLRGYSLTEEQPALSANLGYDAASGLYLGASGIAGYRRDSGPRAVGYIAYGGYAHRFSNGRSLDVGLSRTRLNAFEPYRWSHIRYTEVYLGGGTEHFSLRALYSPHYVRPGAQSLYLDFAASARPAERWRVSGHAGLLHYLDRPRSIGRTDLYDLRAVIAREFDRGDLHVAWTLRGPDGDASSTPRERRSSLGVGLTYVF